MITGRRDSTHAELGNNHIMIQLGGGNYSKGNSNDHTWKPYMYTALGEMVCIE